VRPIWMAAGRSWRPHRWRPENHQPTRRVHPGEHEPGERSPASSSQTSSSQTSSSQTGSSQTGSFQNRSAVSSASDLPLARSGSPRGQSVRSHDEPSDCDQQSAICKAGSRLVNHPRRSRSVRSSRFVTDFTSLSNQTEAGRHRFGKNFLRHAVSGRRPAVWVKLRDSLYAQAYVTGA
jgi:hypothetical protein